MKSLMKRAETSPATGEGGKSTTVIVDGYTRFCLTAITVLLTVLIVALWAGAPSSVGPVQAQEARYTPPDTGGIGNPAAQRLAIQQAIEQGNKTLDKIHEHLQSGKVQVIILEVPKDNAPVQQNK